MFENFDFSLLDDPDFKEDAVREEIIVPVLKRLGYQASGTTRIQRSKPLRHPFVHIGTRKHPVNIVPDYTLYALARLWADARMLTGNNLKDVTWQKSYAFNPPIKSPLIR